MAETEDRDYEILDGPPPVETGSNEINATPAPEGADTPPSNPATETKQPEGGQPESPWWKENGFDSEDTVRQAALSQRSLQSEVTALREQLEESSFADPLLGTLNQYLKQNSGMDVSQTIGKFSRVHGLNLDEMQPLDIIREAMITVEGYTPDEVKAYVMAKLTPPRSKSEEELADMDVDERHAYDQKMASYKVEVSRMVRDSKEKLSSLKSQFTPQPVEKPSPEQIEAQRNEQAQAIRSALPVEISITGLKDLDPIKYNLAEEQMNMLQNAFAGSPMRGEGLTAAMTTMAKGLFFDEMIRKILTESDNQRVAQTHAELSNASPNASQSKGAPTDDPNEDVQRQIDRALNGY